MFVRNGFTIGFVVVLFVLFSNKIVNLFHSVPVLWKNFFQNDGFDYRFLTVMVCLCYFLGQFVTVSGVSRLSKSRLNSPLEWEYDYIFQIIIALISIAVCTIFFMAASIQLIFLVSRWSGQQPVMFMRCVLAHLVFIILMILGPYGAVMFYFQWCPRAQKRLDEWIVAHPRQFKRLLNRTLDCVLVFVTLLGAFKS